MFLLLASPVARAQEAPPLANPPRVDSPNEWDKLKGSCLAFKVKEVPNCAEELFTGHPVHVAVGSIAPQNGFGAGLAYLGHENTDNWRISWNADAVGSINSSWRAGAYFKFVHSGGTKEIGIHKGTKGMKPNWTGMPEHSVITLYAQAISLNKLTYFGLGPSATEAGRSFYGMRETIIGASGVKPDLYRLLHFGIYGEINGRFVDIRPSNGQPSPPIEQLYTETTAPGLTTHPGTLQFGEGMRMAPISPNDVVRLNYNLEFQQFFAPGNSTFSFQRLTVDLNHQFALYGETTRAVAPRPSNGPDQCFEDPGAKKPECPKPFVRNREGTVGVRVFSALSMTPGGNIVPFYFQPTLGGSDINGNSSLPSYQDLRFRAPNVLLFRESFEHSIFSLPLGFALMADEGKVALRRGDLGPNPWLHSFSAGLTLRAGGFPQVYLLFSWGGNEGTHTIANVNNSLLGGSARPSLF